MLSQKKLQDVLDQISKDVHTILPEEKHSALYREYVPITPAKPGFFSPSQSIQKLDEFLVELKGTIEQTKKDTYIQSICEAIKAKAIELKNSPTIKLESLCDFIVDIKQGKNKEFGKPQDIDTHVVLRDLIACVKRLMGVPKLEPKPSFIGIYGL